MTRTFAQNIDNEKKVKQNVLQVAKSFPRYNKKNPLRIGVGLRSDEHFIWESMKANLEINSSKMKCQGSGSNGPPGCSRGEKMVPRNAKTEAPKPTNGYYEEVEHDTHLYTAQRQ